MSSFDLLNLGTQALRANQTALSAVGQNVSNVNTPGYSRQVANFNSLPDRAGVLVEGVDRITNQFLTQQLWKDLSSYKEAAAYTALSAELDNLLASKATSASAAIDSYFSAMQNVVDDPVSIPNRELFVAEADSLVKRFNDLDQNIRQQHTRVNDEIAGYAAQVTTLASNIADINDKIRLAVTAGNPSNELHDQREELTNKLSELVGIRVIEQGDEYNIFIGNGQPLVIGQRANSLVALQGNPDPSQTELALVVAGNQLDVGDELSGGQLGGLLRYRNEELNNALDELGLMAIGLAQSMNAQHKTGIDLNNQFGTEIFGDMNASNLQRSRIAANTDNQSKVNHARVEIQDIGQLQASEYELVYDSPDQISLIRKSDGKQFSLSQMQDVVNNRTVDANALSWGGNTAPVLGSAASENINLVLNGVALPAVAVDSAKGLADLVNSQPGLSGLRAETAVNIGPVTEAGGNGVDFNLVVKDAAGTDQTVAVSLATGETTQASVFARINAALDSHGADFSNLELSFADGGVKLLDNTGGNIQLDASGGADADVITLNNYAANGSLLGATSLTANLPGSDIATATGYLVENTAQAGASITTLDLNASGSTLLGAANVTLVDAGNNVESTRNNQVAGIAEVGQGEYYLNEDEGILSFAMDGFKATLDMRLRFVSGDRFLIQPVRNGGEQLSLTLKDGRELALAAPVRVSPKEENSGTGVARLANVNPDAATFDKVPAELAPPVDMVFNSGEPLTYTLYDMSDSSNPTVLDLGNGPLANQPYTSGAEIDLQGYSIVVNNQPETGDRFSFRFNADGVSDNRNAIALSDLQQQKLLARGSYQDLYGSLVEEVGTRTATSRITEEASKSVLKSTTSAKASVAGVNLEEEAAKLIQFQQAYQASAQIIRASQTLFDSLINSI